MLPKYSGFVRARQMKNGFTMLYFLIFFVWVSCGEHRRNSGDNAGINWLYEEDTFSYRFQLVF